MFDRQFVFFRTSCYWFAVDNGVHIKYSDKHNTYVCDCLCACDVCSYCCTRLYPSYECVHLLVQTRHDSNNSLSTATGHWATALRTEKTSVITYHWYWLNCRALIWKVDNVSGKSTLLFHSIDNRSRHVSSLWKVLFRFEFAPGSWFLCLLLLLLLFSSFSANVCAYCFS